MKPLCTIPPVAEPRDFEQGLLPEDIEALALQAAERRRFERQERSRIFWRSRRSMDANRYGLAGRN